MQAPTTSYTWGRRCECRCAPPRRQRFRFLTTSELQHIHHVVQLPTIQCSHWCHVQVSGSCRPSALLAASLTHAFVPRRIHIRLSGSVSDLRPSHRDSLIEYLHPSFHRPASCTTQGHTVQRAEDWIFSPRPAVGSSGDGEASQRAQQGFLQEHARLTKLHGRFQRSSR